MAPVRTRVGPAGDARHARRHPLRPGSPSARDLRRAAAGRAAARLAALAAGRHPARRPRTRTAPRAAPRLGLAGRRGDRARRALVSTGRLVAHVAHPARARGSRRRPRRHGDGPPQGLRRGAADVLRLHIARPDAAFARRRHLFRRIGLVSREVDMSSRRIVSSCAFMAAIVAAGSWYAVSAFPLQHSMTFVPAPAQQDGPGPLEQRANPITPENPVPRRVTSENMAYPAEAAAIEARGEMTLQITLDEFGRVAEARPTAVRDSGAAGSQHGDNGRDRQPFCVASRARRSPERQRRRFVEVLRRTRPRRHRRGQAVALRSAVQGAHLVPRDVPLRLGPASG